MPWYSRLVRRLRDDSQFLRSTIQLSFVLLCLWIGIEFRSFVVWLSSNGQLPYHDRPPGAEGFLPISALISLKYWLETGIINDIHPSGLFILIAIVAVGFLLKKSFCSWLCPIGTLSEALWMLGKRLFGRNISVTRWLDYPLRSLKYLLLLFFVYFISQMDVPTLRDFIESPYNKVADIKMYLFFADITRFTLWTIIVLMILSVFIKNFWCRYLCPYGALLGIASWLSPFKITRTASTCINCDLCTKACPAGINVHKAHRVWSDECMNCLQCVEASQAPAFPRGYLGVLWREYLSPLQGSRCSPVTGRMGSRKKSTSAATSKSTPAFISTTTGVCRSTVRTTDRPNSLNYST